MRVFPGKCGMPQHDKGTKEFVSITCDYSCYFVSLSARFPLLTFQASRYARSLSEFPGMHVSVPKVNCCGSPNGQMQCWKSSRKVMWITNRFFRFFLPYVTIPVAWKLLAKNVHNYSLIPSFISVNIHHFAPFHLLWFSKW